MRADEFDILDDQRFTKTAIENHPPFVHGTSLSKGTTVSEGISYEVLGNLLSTGEC